MAEEKYVQKIEIDASQAEKALEELKTLGFDKKEAVKEVRSFIDETKKEVSKINMRETVKSKSFIKSPITPQETKDAGDKGIPEGPQGARGAEHRADLDQ